MIEALAFGVVWLIAFAVGRATAKTDPSALRWLLGDDEPPMFTPPELTKLQERLVAAGWVHQDYVNDPEHFDEAGRYLWWGA